MKLATSLVIAVAGAFGLAIGIGLAGFEVHVHAKQAQDARVQEGTAVCASVFTKAAGGWVSFVLFMRFLKACSTRATQS